MLKYFLASCCQKNLVKMKVNVIALQGYRTCNLRLISATSESRNCLETDKNAGN